MSAGPGALSEQGVRVAVGLYEARRALRSLLGVDYQASIEPWMRLVRLAMEREGKPALSAVLVLAKHARDEPVDVLFLMAAAVEVIEQDPVSIEVVK